jgi:hypothetical protein
VVGIDVGIVDAKPAHPLGELLPHPDVRGVLVRPAAPPILAVEQRPPCPSSWRTPGIPARRGGVQRDDACLHRLHSPGLRRDPDHPDAVLLVDVLGAQLVISFTRPPSYAHSHGTHRRAGACSGEIRRLKVANVADRSCPASSRQSHGRAAAASSASRW